MIRIASITLSIVCAALSLSAIADDSQVQRRAAMIDRIDGLLAQRWAAEGIEPAELSSDGEFVRRVYLDLTGVIPRVAEVREFLEDERSDKRERLIEQLLASPRYPTHLQFYPTEIEDVLAGLESKHTVEMRADKLPKTIFGVRLSNDGYKFHAIEQR